MDKKILILYAVLFIDKSLAYGNTGCNIPIENAGEVHNFLIPRRPLSNIASGVLQINYRRDGNWYEARGTRHHIIPYNVLRDFYNTAILRSQNDMDVFRSLGDLFGNIVASARTTYENYGRNVIQTSNYMLINAESFARDMRSGEVGLNSNLAGDQIRSMELLKILYIWMPGNIFIGPTPPSDQRHQDIVRMDDPGPEFEENAATIVGPARFQILKKMYLIMKAYIRGELEMRIGSHTVPVTVGEIATLIPDIGNYISLYNIGMWTHITEAFPVELIINQRHRSITQERNSSENPRQKRDKSTPALFVFKNFPDPYCVNAYLENVKNIAAVL